MQNTKSAATPLPARYVPTLSVGAPNPETRSRFQTVIGSLLYLMLGTRLDIAFVVTKLVQHAANLSKEHLEQVLYICHYLVGTSKYWLMYNGMSREGISACTDSDWASDNSTCRSQTSYFIKLAKGLISWTSRAQKTIALSSTEAEYMALSDCSHQVVWMHTLLGELSYNLKPIPICRDNQGSIFISSNPITEKCSKHIDIWYHYICKVIARKLAEVYFCQEIGLVTIMFFFELLFLIFLSQFPSMFPLLTYSQSLFSLICWSPKTLKPKEKQDLILLLQE